MSIPKKTKTQAQIDELNDGVKSIDLTGDEGASTPKKVRKGIT